MKPVIGFAKFNMSSVLPGNKPFTSQMMGQVMYAAGSNKALWFSLDLLMLSVPLCARIRRDIASAIGVPAENIVIHVMHNHTAWDDEDIAFGGDRYNIWLDLFINAAKSAMESANPASFTHKRLSTPPGVFVRRRKYVDSLSGKLTVFMGFDKTPDGKADASRINNSRISHWLDEIVILNEKTIYDGPVDDVDLIVFKGDSGDVLGTIARFAGHVIAAGHSPSACYCADFPGVLRNLIEKNLGGVCITINGPCGDITSFEQIDFCFPDPKAEPTPEPPICMKHTYAEQTQEEITRLGNTLFSVCADYVPMDFHEIDDVLVTQKDLELPMRDDLENIETADKLRDDWLIRFNNLVKTKSSLDKIKQAADKWLFYSMHQQFYGALRLLWPDDLRNKHVTADVINIRVGDIVLTAMPGEIFLNTGKKVRNEVESRGFISLTAGECNGDIGYIPDSDEYKNGDYETCASVTSPETADIIADACIEMIRDHVYEKNPVNPK